MRKLTIVLLFALLTTIFAPFIAAPPDVTAQDGPTIYSDPQGRFNVILPAGWTETSTPDYAQFVNPDGVKAAFAFVDAADESAGVVLLQTLFGIPAEADLLGSNPATLPSGNWTQYIYAYGDTLSVLIVRATDGQVAAMWFEGSDTAINTAEADLVSIASTYANGPLIDLTARAARDLTADDFATIEATMIEALATYHVPAAAVAIVQNGQVVYANGFGTLDDGSPTNADTLFMIGSVTKSMTSFVAATLVDEGKLAWDQPVTDVLPQFAMPDPSDTAKIRVRDLYNMSTGVRGDDVQLFLEAPTPPQLVANLASADTLGPPHTVFNYNNQMVGIGGFALGVANGVPLEESAAEYERLLQERLFGPLGMTASTANFDDALANPNRATPYDYDPVLDANRAIPLDWERFVLPVAPAGAVWSSVNDMGHYLMMELAGGLASDGTRVVSAENLAETHAAARTTDGQPLNYAMGWVPEMFHGQRLVWHNGGTLGFSTYCGFLPDADLGIIVLSNRAGADGFYSSIRDLVFEQAFDLPHTSAANYASAETEFWNAVAEQLRTLPILPIDPAAVEPYLGEYETGLRVEMRGDSLWFVAAFMDAQIAPLPDGEPGQYIIVNTPALSGLAVNFSHVAGQAQLTVGLPGDEASYRTYRKS